MGSWYRNRSLLLRASLMNIVYDLVPLQFNESIYLLLPPIQREELFFWSRRVVTKPILLPVIGDAYILRNARRNVYENCSEGYRIAHN